MTYRTALAQLCAVTALLALALSAGCGEPALDRRSSGDPRAGMAAFKFAGCAGCHAIANVAVGDVGPALDGEGNRRSAPWLRAMLPRHARAASAALRPVPHRDFEDMVSYLVTLR